MALVVPSSLGRRTNSQANTQPTRADEALRQALRDLSGDTHHGDKVVQTRGVVLGGVPNAPFLTIGVGPPGLLATRSLEVLNALDEGVLLRVARAGATTPGTSSSLHFG